MKKSKPCCDSKKKVENTLRLLNIFSEGYTINMSKTGPAGKAIDNKQSDRFLSQQQRREQKKTDKLPTQIFPKNRLNPAKFGNISGAGLKQSAYSGIEARNSVDHPDNVLSIVDINNKKLDIKVDSINQVVVVQDNSPDTESEDNTQLLDNMDAIGDEPIINILAMEEGVHTEVFSVMEKLTNELDDIKSLINMILTKYADYHHLPAPLVSSDKEGKLLLNMSIRAKHDLHDIRSLAKSYYRYANDGEPLDSKILEFKIDSNDSWFCVKDGMKWLVDPKDQYYAITTADDIEKMKLSPLSVNPEEHEDDGREELEDELREIKAELEGEKLQNSELAKKLQIMEDNSVVKQAQIDSAITQNEELMQKLSIAEQEISMLKQAQTVSPKTVVVPDKIPTPQPPKPTPAGTHTQIKIISKKDATVSLTLNIPDDLIPFAMEGEAPSVAKTILTRRKAYHQVAHTYPIKNAYYSK